MQTSTEPRDSIWPSLPFEEWSETCATLHLWTQIVGKIRLAQSPWINHYWQATFYVTARGITTSPIPHGDLMFEIQFDFLDHRLTINVSNGRAAWLTLDQMSVASFYGGMMREMENLGIPVAIYGKPNEVADPIRFDQDEIHRAYDRDYANRFWRILVQSDRVMKQFRGRFTGKVSPVHLFWGALDLAVTRFSGRRAPPHPGGVPNLPDYVTREAYSQEVSSCGFWPGGQASPFPGFYSYAYPEPPGFSGHRVLPEAASYSDALHEFVLPYDAVRLAPDPDEILLAFLQSTYEAAAELANWDRHALEVEIPGERREQDRT